MSIYNSAYGLIGYFRRWQFLYAAQFHSYLHVTICYNFIELEDGEIVHW